MHGCIGHLISFTDTHCPAGNKLNKAVHRSSRAAFFQSLMGQICAICTFLSDPAVYSGPLSAIFPCNCKNNASFFPDSVEVVEVKGLKAAARLSASRPDFVQFLTRGEIRE